MPNSKRDSFRQSIDGLKTPEKINTTNAARKPEMDNEEEDSPEDQPRKIVKVSKTEGVNVPNTQNAAKKGKDKKSKAVTPNVRDQSRAKIIKSFNDNPVFAQIGEEEHIKYAKNIELNIFDRFYLHADNYTDATMKLCDILEKLRTYKYLSQLIVKSMFNLDKLEHLEQLEESGLAAFEKEAEKLLTGMKNDSQSESAQNGRNNLIKFQTGNGQPIQPKRQSSFRGRFTQDTEFRNDSAIQHSQNSQFKRRTQSELITSDPKSDNKELSQDPTVLFKTLQTMGVDKVQQLANTLPENEKLLIFLTLSSMAKEQDTQPQSNGSTIESHNAANKKDN